MCILIDVFTQRTSIAGLTVYNIYLYQVFLFQSHGILIFSPLYYSISSLKEDTGTKRATIKYIVLEVQKQEQRAIRTSKLRR
jgi:hypothetical protein